MNARQLEKIGIPASAVKTAIQAVQQLAKLPDIERRSIPRRLQQVAESPQLFLGDPVLDALAKELLDTADSTPVPVSRNRSQQDDGRPAKVRQRREWAKF